MGGSTFLIGCVPGYASIGGWAPLLVLLLRLMQGLALGGEYGGAATYVAEHACQPARLLYQFHTNHGHPGIVFEPGGDIIRKEVNGRGSIHQW